MHRCPVHRHALLWGAQACIAVEYTGMHQSFMTQPLLVQGDAQCCMTGAAFEHMLQLGDQSLLEIVMHNVVVLSRMKSEQKGQVMALLGSKGLQHVHGGQQQHIAVSTTVWLNTYSPACSFEHSRIW